MPALTHGRVANGFNLLPRSVKEVKTKTKCGDKKACCISTPHQYNNMHPGKIFQSRRVPTKPCNRKYASTVVTGRSFATKRAIARRVANCNSQHSRTANTISFNIILSPPDNFLGEVTIDYINKWLGINPYLSDTNISNNVNPANLNFNFIKLDKYVVKILKFIQEDETYLINIKANYTNIYDCTITKETEENVIFKILSKNTKSYIKNPNILQLTNSYYISFHPSGTFTVDFVDQPGCFQIFPSDQPYLPEFKMIPGASSINCCCNYPTVSGNKNININKHNKCN